jgi:hypothetical protein
MEKKNLGYRNTSLSGATTKLVNGFVVSQTRSVGGVPRCRYFQHWRGEWTHDIDLATLFPTEQGATAVIEEFILNAKIVIHGF